MLRALAGVIALAFAVQAAAQAQEWQFRSFDDGAYFTGLMSPGADRDVMFLCGERSPKGLTAQQTGNMEPDITPRDSLRIYIGEGVLGSYDGVTQRRQDVLLIVGATGYRLPVVNRNSLYSSWEADLPATDAVFAAIAAGSDFEIRSDTGARVLTSRGFLAAHTALTRHCQSMFTAIGKPWTSVPAAAAPVVSMREVAEASIRSGCGGPATLGPEALHSGDIDGDGLEDVVVYWNGITCSAGYPRPFCGASACSAKFFVSSLHARGVPPKNLLTQGVRMQPLSNGNTGVATTGRLSSCQNRPNCEFIWYWNGREITLLE